MDKQLMKTATILFCIFMVTATLAYATYYVWELTTYIKVTEPFSVETDLPTNTTLCPGVYDFTINVTNNGGIDYNATLYYWIDSYHATCNITPANGSTYHVSANTTVSIPITINVTLSSGYPYGTININWAIERVEVGL